MNKVSRVLLLLILVLGAGSCLAPQHAFVVETNPYGWPRRDAAVVQFENRDTITLRTLDVVVRYGFDFEYDRLSLALTTITPDGYRWCDTVVVSIPNKFPTLDISRDVNHTYRRAVRLNQTGNYIFSFTPIMPEDEVVGIAAVGVDVY